MKILYIWVEKLGILNRIGVPFDGEFFVDYDQAKSAIVCKRNADYYHGIFSSKEAVASESKLTVTAIVGNNGSGKTTIANLIDLCCKPWPDGKFLITWKEGDAVFLHANGIPPPSIHGESIRISDQPPNFQRVYYSPHYHPLHRISYENHDISTSHLITSDEEYFHNSTNIDQATRDPVRAHGYMEYLRNAEFISEYYGSKNKAPDLGLRIPRGCRVSFNDIDFLHFKNMMSSPNGERVPHSSLVLNQILNIERIPKSDSNSNRERFIRVACSRLISNYLRTILSSSAPYDLDKRLIKLFEKHFDIPLSLDEVIENTVSFFKEISRIEILDKSGKKIKYNERKSAPSSQFISFVAKIPDEFFRHQDNSDDNSIYFDLAQDSKLKSHPDDRIKLWVEFLRLFFLCKNSTPFLLFDWIPAISAGEYSHLNLYSRLHSKMKSIFENVWDGKALLFLDEVEVTLHPELQKKLVLDIIKYFEHYYPGQSVHVFFATHSPIILSDIPAQNCIFLKRTGSSIAVSKDKMPTFGANIYSLYKHPFFMNKGLTGLLAESKINGLIETLRSEAPISEDELQRCEKLIDLIGEDFLRDSLLNELIRRYPKARRIEALEKEIARLRNDSDTPS